jgi:hypothetical protein
MNFTSLVHELHQILHELHPNTALLCMNVHDYVRWSVLMQRPHSVHAAPSEVGAVSSEVVAAPCEVLV